MGQLIKTKALVMGAIRWKESSKIVTLYTREFGKQKVIARGAYRKNSPLSGILETMNYVEVVLDFKSSRELNLLREINLESAFNKLRSQFDAFMYGMALLEIINQVFEENDSDSLFFDFTITQLDQLEQLKQPHVGATYFLLKLLSFLGFKPQLADCQSGDTQLCAGQVHLSMESGDVYCRQCGLRGDSYITLSKAEYIWLRDLQNAHHRRIYEWESLQSSFPSVIGRLIKYLNYHLQHTVHIESLSLTEDGQIA